MMLRQQAFTGDRETPMLKGALHCHMTRSDGRNTPEEVIRIHAEKGYDFLAITDHRIYNRENAAPQYGVTVLPGMEYDGKGFPTITDNDDTLTPTFDSTGFRYFHTVCIGPAREDCGFAQDRVFPTAPLRCQEDYQPHLDMLHGAGQLTVFCHPQRSSTPARYFAKLRGLCAMEIWNSGSVIEMDMDRDAAYWDEILGQGIRIWGVAADDGHESGDHGIGWVRVRAQSNRDTDILAALRDGKFYSSCGPEIYDFRYEDGQAVVVCSESVRVRLHADKHPTRIVRAENGSLTRAVFEIGDSYSYIRATVIDRDGRYAWTNQIFLK